MKIGDPRHATLLMIVALGAVGFVIIQVLPSANQGSGAPSTTASQSTGTPDFDQQASNSLTTDPFSHASLAVDRAKSVADSANAKRAQMERAMQEGEIESGPPSGIAPWDASQIVGSGLPGASLRPDSSQRPAKNAGSSQQLNQAPDVVVELQAVLKVKDRAAFVAVNGEEARTFRQGDVIAEGVRLARIFDDSIVLSSGSKSFRISIGGNQKL